MERAGFWSWAHHGFNSDSLLPCFLILRGGGGGAKSESLSKSMLLPHGTTCTSLNGLCCLWLRPGQPLPSLSPPVTSSKSHPSLSCCLCASISSRGGSGWVDIALTPDLVLSHRPSAFREGNVSCYCLAPCTGSGSWLELGRYLLSNSGGGGE